MKLADFIEEKIDFYQLEFRVHATRRMFQRNILEDDVELVLKNGEIIEKYEDDFPLPSILINGRTRENTPLHLVVGINTLEKVLIIITAYNPNHEKWGNDFSRRTK